MLITRDFVFLHLPKTGGEFLKLYCEEYMPWGWVVEHDRPKHAGERKIPEQYRLLPRFGLVRNPWDWYVSWYHYLLDGGERVRYPDWFAVSDNCRLGFKDTIVNLLEGRFEEANPRVANLIASHDIGLLSVHHEDMYLNSIEEGRISIGRTENLVESFLEFAKLHRLEHIGRVNAAMLEARPLNRSKRSAYQKYYDDELREMVAHKDRLIIERYGYVFQEIEMGVQSGTG